MNEQFDLHGYVDGEMSATEKKAIEAQLASNPDLAREVESIRSLKSFVSRNAVGMDCSAAWAGCSSRIAELERSKRAERFVTRNAWALCGSFAFLIVSAGMWHKMTAPKTLQNGDFFKAAADLAGRGGSQSTDRTVLNRALDGLLGKGRENLKTNRPIVRGLYEGEMNGHRLQRFEVTDKRGDMVLVAIDEKVSIEGISTSPELPGYGLGRMGNANCVEWVDQGRTLILMGEREFSDLADAAKNLSR